MMRDIPDNATLLTLKIPWMRTDDNIIFMRNRDTRRRIPVLRDNYLMVRDCILEMMGRNSKVMLTDLIEHARASLVNRFAGDIGWYVVRVKVDLESRGVIQQTKPDGCIFPYLSLTHNYPGHLHLN
jgi:hypothetical protein